MKNSSLAFVALMAACSTLGFTACSNETDSPQVPEKDNGEIRFAASTDLSRVQDVTTNNLTAFNVYAYTTSGDETNLFMDNVKVTKTASNVWSYSPVQYWPAKQSVDFYAYAPESWVGEDGPLKPVPYYAWRVTPILSMPSTWDFRAMWDSPTRR